MTTQQCAHIGIDGHDVQCERPGVYALMWEGRSVGSYCAEHADHQLTWGDGVTLAEVTK